MVLRAFGLLGFGGLCFEAGSLGFGIMALGFKSCGPRDLAFLGRSASAPLPRFAGGPWGARLTKALIRRVSGSDPWEPISSMLAPRDARNQAPRDQTSARTKKRCPREVTNPLFALSLL